MVNFFKNRCPQQTQIREAVDLSKIIKSPLQKRKLAWLGHVLRMPPKETPNAALETPNSRKEKEGLQGACVPHGDG